MFAKREMREIDRKYFKPILETAYHVQLKSKNTGHIWDIECRPTYGNYRSLVVYHKHKGTDPFHEQLGMHPKTISEAQELIKNHDKWHLNGRK